MVTNMKNSSLLRKVEAFEKMATYGDRSSFLKSLGEEPLGPGLSEESDQVVSGKPPLSQDIKTAPWAGTVKKMIDPKVQGSLNKLFGLNLKLDGDLGPQTAQALQLYKNKYHDARHIYDPTFQKDVVLQGDLSAMPAVASRVSIPLFEKLATPAVPFFLTLAQGANLQLDPMIQRVQESLNKMRYTDSSKRALKEDGLLGPNTQFAINKYVADKKLTGDKDTIYNAIREAAEGTEQKPAGRVPVTDKGKAWMEEARQTIINALPKLVGDPKLGVPTIAWLNDTISPIMAEPLTDTNFGRNMSALNRMQDFLTRNFKKNPQNTAIPSLLRQITSYITDINKMNQIGQPTAK